MEAFETTMETICKKSMKDAFRIEIPKIAANIADPNTSVSEPRTLTLTFTFKPYPDRSGATVQCKAREGLAGLDLSGVTDSVYIAKQNGKFTMFSRDLRQEMLFAGEEESSPDGKTAGAGG